MAAINELVDIVARAAGKRIEKRHGLSKPQGVHGRNCDSTRPRRVLGWEPRISLADGRTRTYAWIRSALEKAGRVRPPSLVP